MVKVLRTILFGTAMLGIGYVVGKPGKGGDASYKILEKDGRSALYDRSADEVLPLARVSGKTFFADPNYNFEGFVRMKAIESLSENYSKKEQKNLLKDAIQEADKAIDDVVKEMQ